MTGAKSGDHYALAFRECPVPMIVSRPPLGEVIDVNKAFCAQFGVSRADVIGRPSVGCDVWAFEQERDRCIADLERDGEARYESVTLCRSDGTRFRCEFLARVLDIGDGPAIVTIVRDVTEQFAAEEALRELTLIQATAESVARIGSWRWDFVTRKVNWSDEMFTLFGIEKSGFDGDVDAVVRNRVHPHDLPAVLAANDDVLELGAPTPLEYRLVMPDGSERWVHAEGQLVRNDGGDPVALTGYVQDITERRHAEEELASHQQELERCVVERTEELTVANNRLAEMVAQLEEATRAKSQFLANVSHELRTPLNSIIGFTGIMQQGLVGELSQEQARQIGMVHESGRHLLELVDDILDLSRVEAGAVGLRPEEFEVPALVIEVGEAVRPLYVEKELELNYACDQAVGVMYSDCRYVRRILLNLVGNAVKFTNEGCVTLHAARLNDMVVFTVTDTGIGITATELEHVFEEFYQVAVPNEAKSRGTGLGLAVSRQLAEALGGSLTVISEPGMGSTFTVMLPARLG